MQSYYGAFSLASFNSERNKEVMMINRRFRCRRCGCRFENKVFENGEAERKGAPTGSVRCPDCKSTDIERI